MPAEVIPFQEAASRIREQTQLSTAGEDSPKNIQDFPEDKALQQFLFTPGIVVPIEQRDAELLCTLILAEEGLPNTMARQTLKAPGGLKQAKNRLQERLSAYSVPCRIIDHTRKGLSGENIKGLALLYAVEPDCYEQDDKVYDLHQTPRQLMLNTETTLPQDY